MRLADTRPPFAGLANLSEAALAALPTPCYLLDEARLRRNGEILLGVQQRTDCKILLAQKAFSNYDLYPVLAPYLAGTEASGSKETGSSETALRTTSILGQPLSLKPSISTRS